MEISARTDRMRAAQKPIKGGEFLFRNSPPKREGNKLLILSLSRWSRTTIRHATSVLALRVLLSAMV